MKKKIIFSLSSVFLAVLLAISCILCYNQKERYSTEARVRTVAVSNKEIDYESILNDFEDGKIEKEGSLTTFEGYKTIKASDLLMFEELSESDTQQVEDSSVKYNFSYDSDTNVVTIAAEMKNENGEIYIDEIKGVGFINAEGQIDAVMNVEGESILLSEMNKLGMIENCGWFSRLVKAVVKVAVVVAVAAVVVATTAAVCVATAGAAAPAVVAAGVGVTASVGATGGALAASTIVTASLAAAAIATGVAVAAQALDQTLTLTNTYVLDFADSVRRTDRADRYILVILSALDQPLVTNHVPVPLEVAKTWFSLGGQVWTPYSSDAINLINQCGYAAGNSKGVIGVAEHNVISTGVYGYYHYHALDLNTGSKIRLPGDGKKADAVVPHAMHCFFYF